MFWTPKRHKRRVGDPVNVRVRFVMGFTSRRLLIWLITLAVVFALYLLYGQWSKRAPVDIRPIEEYAYTSADSNAGEFEGEIGKIGGVGVSTLKKTKFLHRNKNKEVDREFGFQELLHEQKNRWEIKKPYLNVYQQNFKCYITADKGQVHVETAAGRPTPKDATFVGNVVIHIVPGQQSDVQESFIYLDDLAFISENSQFSTPGPVKFVSPDAQMFGTGLQFIYDDLLGRLHYFRILDLESLRIKTKTAAFLSTPKTKTDRPADTTGQSEVTRPDKPAAEANYFPKPPPVQPEGQFYKCVFNDHVHIKSPEQFIFAKEQLVINDIFWAKTTGEQLTETGSAKEAVDSNMADAGGAESKVVTAVTAKTKEPGPSAPQSGEPNESAEQLVEVVVTCGDGVIITPVDLHLAPESSTELNTQLTDGNEQQPRRLDEAEVRDMFVARKIVYSASTGNAVADGPSEIRFSSNSFGADANQASNPVKITAQKQTSFLSASSQVIFEGGCQGVMFDTDPNNPQKFALSAPTFTVKLSEGENEQSCTSSTDIERFTATGGVVMVVTPLDSAEAAKDAIKLESDTTLSAEKTTSPETARFTTPRLDYRASTNDIIAQGPTELTFYASDIMGTENKETAVPVKVTARKQTKYLLDLDRVIFEGDCLCSMTRTDPNSQQKYSLSASTLTVDLAEASAPAAGIKFLTAEGGTVRLATLKTKKEKLLGGIELKCQKFNYDDKKRLFLATGPGLIKVNNSDVPESNDTTGKFSLRKPCWVLFENFDRLWYYADANQLVVDGGTEKVKIGYVPIIKGQFGPAVKAQASHIEALLYQTADGQNELLTLTASGGITFEDQENQFVGSELFYDHKKSIMNIKGDESRPCYLNGVLVDHIEYDLETGKVKAQIAGAGALQLPR